MARFLDSTKSVNKEAGRSKGRGRGRKGTTQKAKSPSISQRAQETNDRLSQKYGGGSTRGGSSGSSSRGRSQSQQDTRQNLPNRRYQNTMESRNPRMLDSPTNQRRYVAPMTTNGGSQGRRNQQFLEEERRRKQREAEERKKAAQRQKSGLNSMATGEERETARRMARNTPTVVKESAKQVGIAHGKTLADVTALNESSAIGSKIDIKSPEFQEDIERRRKKSTQKSKDALKALSGMEEYSQAIKDSKTSEAKGFEKAYYGALESGTGMLADRALGPAWAVSMFSRTYGSMRGRAQAEGATESEDRANALLQAAKETATEYMFVGAGLAKGLSGRWSLAPAEKLANLATRNMKGPLADATHAAIRLLGGVGEENAEEAIAWGVEPLIEEYTYKRNVRARKAQATRDSLKAQSDDLRNNIESEEQAEAVAAYLNSPDFIESNVQTYKDTGMSDKDARELAESMRDYLTATLSGDTDTMANIEDELANKFAGKPLSKKSWSLSELMDTFAATTLLTGVTGLPGATSTAIRGDAVRSQLGSDGVRALADTAIDFEDKQASLKAQAMRDRMDSGKDITSTQAYDLMQATREQYGKDSKRQEAAYQTARKAMDSERLVTPYQTDRDGSISLDEVTSEAYQASERSAREAINAVVEGDEKASLTDTNVDRGSQAIAGFQTGVFTVDDANELNYRNTAVRTAFEEVTGIDLSQYVVKGKNGEVDIPATNTATKEALFAMAADNLVKSAQAETANWMDNVKGEVVSQITQRMGSQGTIALQQALDTVDERDRAKYMTTANATDMLYHAAREMGTDWENVKDYAKRMYKGISEEKLKAMYDAGLADRDMASDKARGAQTVIGEAISEVSQENAPMGNLVIETEAPVKGTVARVFSELADNLGVDIHLVDKFVDKDGNVLKNVNGEYRDGAIYINVNSSFEQNVGYIFMHEVTHHLKMFAPEQFNQLEELVREKWFNYDPAQMQSEIAKKIELYKAHGQTLTEEQALEEIIADAAHEFINDPNFAQQVAEENPSLAKAMLNSIRNALRMLRRVLATESIEDETHMNSLFSQLGILDEAERLWLNAYTQAVANRAAVGIEDLQNRIYEEGKSAYSISEDTKGRELSEGQKEFFKDSKARDENGRLIPLYHTTDKGGFTIFDASKSDDQRSLFFASNFAVSQTYARNADSTFEFDENAKFDTWQDFDAFARETFGLSESDSLAREFDISIRDENGRTPYTLGNSSDAMFKSWRRLAESGDSKARSYTVTMTNPYNGQQIQAKSMKSLLSKLERIMVAHGQTRGFYEAYLNLQNPLEVDAEGSMWNEIEFEGQKVKTRKLAEIAEERGYDGVIIRNTVDIGNQSELKGEKESDIYIAFSSEQVKDVRNENPTENPDIRYSVTPEQDANYMDAVERGDMDIAQRMVDEAAISAIPNVAKEKRGKLERPIHLYHGTNAFGFTQFKDSKYDVPFIYTSTDRTVSAHYAGDQHYAGVRQIGRPYREGNSAEDVVENAKWVYGADLKVMSTEDKEARYNQIKEDAIKVADKIDELEAAFNSYSAYAENDMSLMNAIAWVENQFWTIRDGDIQYNFREDVEENEEFRSVLENDVEKFKENIDKVRQFRDDHYKDLESGEKALLNYLCGYDLGDVAIDIEYGMLRLATSEDLISAPDGRNINTPANLKAAIDQAKNIGAYEMYGDLGENPFEFDAGGAQWYGLKVPEVSDDYVSTDTVCKWAYEHGYTSVIMHNIYDYGDKADNYVFFGSSQLKSADPVTYDDNGDVIPLSERFNQETLDIRYSIAEDPAIKDLDEPYMSAVKSGNMEEAQKYVDEAAKRAMPNTKLHGLWYHGTDNDFNIFDFRQGGTHGAAEGFGIYLSDSQEVTSHYGNRQIKGYVNMQRPASAFEQTLTHAELKKLVAATVEHEAQKMVDEYDDDIEAAKKDTWISNYVNTSQISLSEAISETAKAVTKWNGNDMDIVQEIMNGMGIRSYDEAVVFNDILTETTGIDGYMTKWGDEDDMSNPDNPTIAVAFRSNQIKSADTVTYAEDGSIIPLSERFDPTNNDIRYSLSTTDADGNILTDSQMEYFRNSQARDAEGRLQAVYHTTNNGGFTIFDPKYSDDKRSLFFASNFDVSQTYGKHANKPIDVNAEKPFSDLGEFEMYAAEHLEWDENKSLWDNLNASLFNGDEIEDDEIISNWLLGKYSANDGYIALASLPGEDGTRIPIHGNTPENMLYLINSALGRKDIQRGYYSCYLNLENPLIVDAKGANWNRIPYGTVKPNPIREQTLARMESEAEMIVDHISMEWDDFDDNFEGGNYRTLNFELTGKIRMEDGSFDDWSVVESFTIDEKKFAELASSDYDTPGSILSEELGEYWTETLKLSYDYFEDVMNYANDMDGSVDYDSQTANQEAAPDYITSDGYKIDYAELFDELNEEAGENYSPYEGVAAQTYRTRELAEMAEANDYDGVIIRNCRDIGGTSHLKRGENPYSDIFIAFSSNQVKDTRNENPSENPDIRYSFVSDDELAAYVSETAESMDEMYFTDPELEEGRVRLGKAKADFVFSRSTKWNQRWLTEGLVLDEKKTRKAVKEAVMSVMSKAEGQARYKNELVNEAMKTCKRAFYLMKIGKFSEAGESIYDLSRKMVEENNFFDDAYEETFNSYVELRDHIKSMRLYVPDLGAEEYAEHRRNDMGKIWLCSAQKGTPIDEEWDDLCKQWPEWFDIDEAKPTNMLFAIEHALEAAQPMAKALCSEEAVDYIDSLANQLYDIVYEGEEYQSIADEYKASAEKKTAAMKVRFAEAMQKMQATVDEMKAQHRAEVQKLNARNRQNLRTQKMKYDYEIAELKQNREYNIQRLKAEKRRAVKEEKQKNKQRAAERKARAIHKKHFDSITKNYKKLVDRLLTNTKDKNIPEIFKKDLANALAAFDLQTVKSKEAETHTSPADKYGNQYVRVEPSNKTIQMMLLRSQLEKISEETEDFQIRGPIEDLLKRLSDNIEGKTIDELNEAEIADVDDMLKALVHEFNEYKRVTIEGKREAYGAIASAQIEHCLAHAETFGQGKDYFGMVGAIDNIMNMDEVTPAYLFRRIDPERKGIGKMSREIRKSFDKYVRNQAQLNEWMDEILGPYQNSGKAWNKYGADQIAAWRDVKSSQPFNLTNGSITLTPAQMMSLYCLKNREQAMKHIKGAGVVIAPVSFQAKLNSDVKKRMNRTTPVILTDSDIKLIVAQMTKEQIAVAEKLQQLMVNQMAEWGNEASMDVMGIRLFKDKNYFPIKSDKAALKKELNDNEFVQAIRNFGFSKAVEPKANNAIVIDDIFNVVAEHCNNMNLYNAYSKSMDDFMKVYNYHQITREGDKYSDVSVEQALSQAFSKKAPKYIMAFLRDLNGNVSGNGTGIEDMMNKALGNAKKAAVFANGRVALQQPTAIARAFAEISPKYLKGIAKNPSKGSIKATMDEMFEHCPIALWKSWGYYDINMGKSIEDIMMNEGKWLEDKMTDIYGKLDNITWTAIWQMCKAEVEDKHSDVEKGSDEYWELVNDRMTDVVDFTQVVDSPMHRSHAMRNKAFYAKLATSFMAEPTLTYNLFRDGLIRTVESAKMGDKKAAGKALGKTLAVYVGASALTSAFAAVWDAVRGKKPDGDDDEDKDFLGLWLANFLANMQDNLKIWNKVYYVKDVASLLDGWEVSNLALSGWKSFSDGFAQLTGYRYVKSKKAWYENLFGGLGTLYGLPLGTLIKDFKAIYHLVGIDVPLFDSLGEFLDEMPERFGGGESDSGSAGKASGKAFDDDTTVIPDGKVTKDDKAVVRIGKDEMPIDIKDGSAVDNFLNHFGINLTAAEIAQAKEAEAEEKRMKQAEKIRDRYADMDGLARDKKVWSAVTTYIKDNENDGRSLNEFIHDGDYKTVERVREMYLAAGGDEAYFNERILATSKTELKKTISADNTPEQIQAQENIKTYLLDHGMTEQDLSDIAYKSYTATDLKAAIMLNDEQAAIKELRALIQAGLTEEDFYKLWDNRKRFKVKAYKDRGGKYADKFKSTGVYNWPINGTITSGFGHRSSPGGIGSTNHQGMDIAGSMGDPVGASDGGVVTYAGWYGGAGKTVMIQHDDGTVTQYSHLSWWDVHEGDIVGQGQTIGNVGSTGNSTGPHLHFAVMVNGSYVDPAGYLNH